jgi:hypothetical protein
MSGKPKKKSNTATINIDPSLTIEHIAEVYNKFLVSLNSSEEILFEPVTIDEIDLTGIQFLNCILKWKENNSINIKQNFQFSENATILLNRTGFSFLINPR